MIDRRKVNSGANMAGNAEKSKISFDMFLVSIEYLMKERKTEYIMLVCLDIIQS